MVLPFVWGAGMDTRPKKLSSHQPDLVLENYAYIQGVTVCLGRISLQENLKSVYMKILDLTLLHPVYMRHFPT